MEKNQNDSMIGIVLAQRFQIIRLIGQGGMANVYLATDLQTQARVAVKILKRELLNDEELVHRFDVEAKAASSLSHPNIVKVFGVGEENDIRYMVMQYIEGMTLKEMIDQYGKLDWRVALPICVQVAAALQNAHEHGIVHRDIKPHNIMITRDHRALVTDFGIARAATANTITLSGGSAMGSVHYFSPEQARGGIVGSKSDIYSLGIMMYEMLTGVVPFDGDTSVVVAVMHLQETAKSPQQIVNSIPLGLSNIVMKCIRKSPTERYNSANELAAELLLFQKNPGGNYGLVVPDPVEPAQTMVLPNTYTDGNTFNKIRNLEKSIYERRRKRRQEYMIVALVAFTCLVIIGTFCLYVLRGLSDNLRTNIVEDKGVVLNNYVNQDFNTVSNELTRLKVPFATKKEFSDEFPAGIVMEQNIEAGQTVKQVNLNSLVLTVSKGTNEFVLDNYVGRSLLEVENYLRADMGLVIQVEPIPDDVVPQDTIIKTDPPAKANMRPGYTIKIYVSTGPKLITMPNLRGMTYGEAKASLEALKLNLGTVTYEPIFAEDTQVVKAQTPKAGTQVGHETKIDIEMEYGSSSSSSDSRYGDTNDDIIATFNSDR